jgi:hypothetical protein
MLLLVVPAADKERALAAVSHFEGEVLSYHLADGVPGREPDSPHRGQI